MSIIVVTPTRGRPEKAAETYEAFGATRVSSTTKMVFVVDKDDAAFSGYVKAMVPMVSYDHEGGGMGPPMNAAAADHADRFDIIGFVGDDHRFRTKGWDIVVESTLAHGGFAYGDDLARRDIPTQVFISSDIVKALGWFCLPGARHLYLDDTWAQLGREAGCLHFMTGVVIEHAHAFYGKAQMDEGYARVNHPSMYEHDAAVYQQWKTSGAAARDIETVRRVLDARVA